MPREYNATRVSLTRRRSPPRSSAGRSGAAMAVLAASPRASRASRVSGALTRQWLRYDCRPFARPSDGNPAAGPRRFALSSELPFREETTVNDVSEKHLLEKIEDGVAVLTMNRPESLNALSAQMMGALRESVPRLAQDPKVRVIVLTGAGRGFCAGGDVKGMAARADATGPPPSLEERAHGLREGMEVSRWLHEMPKPTIAMMRGPAAGAGL